MDATDFSPPAMIRALGLAKPIYERATVLGHFGNNEMPWEKIR